MKFYKLELFIWLLLTILVILTDINTEAKANTDSVSVLVPQDYFKAEQQLVNTVLTRYHFKKVVLNDSISAVILERYLKSLDFGKLYFLQSDISNFENFKYKIDDYLINGELKLPYDIYNVYLERVNQRIDYVSEVLKNEFDYSKDEYYEVRHDSAQWAVGVTDLNDIWRKRIKYDALNLKLAGKEWDSIVETLNKRYENIRKAISQTKSEDVFQLYLNAYTETVDPHSNYLLPITSDNFKIDMTRALEGIGAQLQAEDEYTKVVEVIAGGPAFKSKLLHRDDKIIGVAQGNDGEMVDVVGWRLNDVVKLIRGPKDSIVRLLILQASEGVNAHPKEITLVRDKVKLEDQSAKMQILEFNNNETPFRIGVISIPAFYVDYEAEQKGDRNFKSTTRDVRKLINDLQSEKVDGIVIDLRNNGGGSLSEAIELTGLFIKDGPVVQVKQSNGYINVEDDPDPGIAYDGPLSVLVNRFSASASEIFSAAIQDYGRGIVLGEQTFGKGTVQNLIDLNKISSKTSNTLGQVKITIAKFYRISGGSTQNLGVIPDINFPSPIDADEFGESSEPNALPWDQILAAKYHPYTNTKDLIPLLQNLHNSRIKSDIRFQSFIDDVNEAKKTREKNSISLNESVRIKEKEVQDVLKEKRKKEVQESSNVKLINKEEILLKESNSEDVLLNESGYILSDLIHLTTG
jgi:carboxyl-terminal processing protease